MPTVEELRLRHAQTRRSGRSHWIHLAGLALDDKNHVAALTALEAAGLGAQARDLAGTTVILDWGSARRCSAEGLVMFQVAARILSGVGAQVFVVPPSFADVRSVVEAPSFLAGCGGAVWVDGVCEDSRRVQAVGTVGAFSSVDRGSLAEFSGSFEVGVGRLPMSNELQGLVMSLAMEVIQNVRSHARASNAGILGLYFHRMRPGLLELGVADDGRGLADSLLDQSDHRWMERFLDVSVLETLFQRNLSSRSGTGGPDSAATGGLGAVLDMLFAQAPTTVFLRSGRVLVHLASDGGVRRATTLPTGIGTQLRIAVKLPRTVGD